MRILYKTIAIVFTSVSLFCCAMNYDNSIFIETSDQKATIFNRLDINQSSVLSVLYAHQKKKHFHVFTIPEASKKSNDIMAKDVRVLRSLLKHQDDRFVPYMDGLSSQEHIYCAHAAYVLGAQRQLFHVLNYVFTPDITKCIGSHLITSDVQSYLIQQFIKKQEIIDPYNRNVEDLIFSSNKRGPFFYMPLELPSYRDKIFCDGSAAFLPTVPVGGQQDELCIGAMSKHCAYYVTGINNIPGEQATLWSFENDIFSKNKKKILGNEGKITQVVFSTNEHYVVVGSDGEQDNLLFLPTEPFDDADAYWLSGYEGAVSKIIVTDDGRYIVSAYKGVAEVIIWDMEYQTGQWLNDNYKYSITAMTFSKNDKQLWICSGPIISLWHIADDGSVELSHSMCLDDEDAIICRLLVNEQLGRIVVGRTDGKLNILCMVTNKEIACLEGHKNVAINGLVSNAEGTMMVSSTDDIADNLIVWDMRTGDCIARLKGHPGITSLLLTYDMRYIVSQSFFKTCLWSMYGAREVETLHHIKNELSFLHCYELYNLYKMVKNGYTIDRFKTNWVESLPIAVRVKEFVQKYLL